MAKSKRVKTNKPPLISVESWDGADELILKVGQLQVEIENLQSDQDESIAKIKAETVKAVKLIQGQIKHITNSLEAYATSNRKDIGTAKSKKMNFGTIGWRMSKSITIKKDTTLQLIHQVFSKAKAKIYIRVKETVDKDALARLKDEQLVSIGAQRKVKDAFFVEPSTTQAVDYE